MICGIQSAEGRQPGDCVPHSVFVEGRRGVHTVVCSCRPRPGFSAQYCWRFRRAGSLLWGSVLSVIGCLLAASPLGARDPSPPRPTPMVTIRNVSLSGVPWEARSCLVENHWRRLNLCQSWKLQFLLRRICGIRGETSFGLHIPVQFETSYHVHGLLFPKAGTGKHEVREFLSF